MWRASCWRLLRSCPRCCTRRKAARSSHSLHPTACHPCRATLTLLLATATTTALHAIRDLKAENVLMVGDGSWVLCDFGSATSRAKVYTDAAERAAEEEIIRKHTTPAYRAPEVRRARSRQLAAVR